MFRNLNRRSFLRVAGALGLSFMFDRSRSPRCAASPGPQGSTVRAWRRSSRGRHVSNAAKKNNANHLYATQLAASLDRAHPGDRSRVVPVVISAALFQSLFRDGRASVDLRHDLRTLADYRALQRCLGGPGAPIQPGCEAGDYDRDGTSDLRDLSVFQRTFTGS